MATTKILAFDPIRSGNDSNHLRALMSGANRMPNITLANKKLGIELGLPAIDQNGTAKGINMCYSKRPTQPGMLKFQTVNSGFWSGMWHDLSEPAVRGLAGSVNGQGVRSGMCDHDVIFLDQEDANSIDYNNANTFKNIAILGHQLKTLNPNILLCFWYRINSSYTIRQPNGNKLEPDAFTFKPAGSNAASFRPAEHAAAFSQALTWEPGFATTPYTETGNKSVNEIWSLRHIGAGYKNYMFTIPHNENIDQENNSTACIYLGDISGHYLHKRIDPTCQIIGFQWFHVEENLFVDNYRGNTSLGLVKQTDKMIYPANVYEAGTFWAFWLGIGSVNWDSLGDISANPDRLLYDGHPNSPNVWNNAEYLGNANYNPATYEFEGLHLNITGHLYDAVMRAAHLYSQVQDVADVAATTWPTFEYRRESCDQNANLSWGSWTSYTPPTNGSAAAQAMLDKVPYLEMRTNGGTSVIAVQDFFNNVPHRTEVRLTMGGASETVSVEGNSIGVFRK
jgi:hypothetical protein